MLLLVAALVGQFVAMIVVAYSNSDTRVTITMIVATFIFFALIGSTLAMTYYSIEGPVLKIVSGPFRWKVQIDQISSIQPTRSLLSSPALSMDRLKIIWGNNKKIIVSPADKKGFVKALGMELSG
jgi:hypothetical protein